MAKPLKLYGIRNANQLVSNVPEAFEAVPGKIGFELCNLKRRLFTAAGLRKDLQPGNTNSLQGIQLLRWAPGPAVHPLGKFKTTPLLIDPGKEILI